MSLHLTSSYNFIMVISNIQVKLAKSSVNVGRT
jgi:hypothetical protein